MALDSSDDEMAAKYMKSLKSRKPVPKSKKSLNADDVFRFIDRMNKAELALQKTLDSADRQPATATVSKSDTDEVDNLVNALDSVSKNTEWLSATMSSIQTDALLENRILFTKDNPSEDSQFFKMTFNDFDLSNEESLWNAIAVAPIVSLSRTKQTFRRIASESDYSWRPSAKQFAAILTTIFDAELMGFDEEFVDDWTKYAQSALLTDTLFDPDSVDDIEPKQNLRSLLDCLVWCNWKDCSAKDVEHWISILFLVALDGSLRTDAIAHTNIKRCLAIISQLPSDIACCSIDQIIDVVIANVPIKWRYRNLLHICGLLSLTTYRFRTTVAVKSLALELGETASIAEIVESPSSIVSVLTDWFDRASQGDRGRDLDSVNCICQLFHFCVTPDTLHAVGTAAVGRLRQVMQKYLKAQRDLLRTSANGELLSDTLTMVSMNLVTSDLDVLLARYDAPADSLFRFDV